MFMWAAIIFAINKIKKIIIGTPLLAYSNNTTIPLTNSNSYVTVFDVTGVGEVESLIFASNQYTIDTSGNIAWVPRITVDGQVITPQSTDLAAWRNWTAAGTYRMCVLPLQSFRDNNLSAITTRASCLTPISGTYQDAISEGGKGIKFCKSCKVEIYVGPATGGGEVHAYYRATYVQR